MRQFRVFLHNKLDAWLKRRIPASSQHELTSKNIFIMPTRFGFAFLLFILLLFLMATNYQNNIIMLFSYLMASLFLTVMMTSFYNLSGLIVKTETMARGHAQAPISYTITLLSEQRRFDINLSFDSQQVKHLSLCRTGKNLILIPFVFVDRGRHSPGRLRISSEYCFGLFVTWTRLDFGCQAIVYPKIKKLNSTLPVLSTDNGSKENVPEQVSGQDDFYQLQRYLVGEPISRIAWKQYAKGQGKLTKHYIQEQGDLCWLRLIDMPANDNETKLQLLCFLIIEHSKLAHQFGVDLGNTQIPINTGKSHMEQCLIALADYSAKR